LASTESFENGASEGIRTLDIHVGNVMLYQLSYARFLLRRRSNYKTSPEMQALFWACRRESKGRTVCHLNPGIKLGIKITRMLNSRAALYYQRPELGA